MNKSTMWTELKMSDCVVLDRQIGEFTGNVVAMKISHPLLKRARWLVLSKRGNFYSRSTGKEADTYADGYILKM